MTEQPDPTEQTLEEQIERDSNPETDEDDLNHRYDAEPNIAPPENV